jgi:hypothetical protein
MLAMRREPDVADQHEIFVRFGFAKSARQRLGRNFLVAAIEFVERGDDPLRRADEPLADGIVAEIGDERAHRRLGFLARGPGLGRRRRMTNVIGKRPAGPRLDDGFHRFSSRRYKLQIPDGSAYIMDCQIDTTNARHVDPGA